MNLMNLAARVAPERDHALLGHVLGLALAASRLCVEGPVMGLCTFTVRFVLDLDSVLWHSILTLVPTFLAYRLWRPVLLAKARQIEADARLTEAKAARLERKPPD